ncbi:hypothetical protein [Intestinibacillus sp. Marseille-P6563]|uniref:hypothetical protein n=1 Tax=Intestinibacillus sp. Marseille-P6563 TaxID=2364792 RepID=UPI000F04F635|nr:hypothetical protein [Intestinibacillus sp. Marseille-P6563]
MSPNIGRPKSNNPRDLQYRLRLTEDEVNKLNFCCRVLGLTKAEVLRNGLEIMFEKAQSSK